ncbi:unnamed protein product [Ectocarpus fasciculatus]
MAAEPAGGVKAEGASLEQMLDDGLNEILNSHQPCTTSAAGGMQDTAGIRDAMADTMADAKHFVHMQSAHFVDIFFFYAYGNTPPTDLLQHIPHDAPHAEILSLGCGDLRDFLYSVLLHGRRGVSCGPVPRRFSFTMNDWEPAIHARNLMLLQMFLDARDILESSGSDAENKSSMKSSPPRRGNSRRHGSGRGSSAAAFAQRIGVIFSSMYNSFVDAEVLEMIERVAGRLAAAAESPSTWASAELGRLVQFADDRSQQRVRKILAVYADGSLQRDGSAAHVKRDRAAVIATYCPPRDDLRIYSRAMGLASFRQSDCMRPYAEMRLEFLKEGVLDPFPLLLEDGAESRKRRGSFDLVNPLLLVTETKGMAYSLHYAAFPLDAFHTDVGWWKLRPENIQGEFGKVAPKVTKPQGFDLASSGVTQAHSSFTPTAKMYHDTQNAWFITALEELSQMCGAFVRATAKLRISIHVGDALNCCDALLAASAASSSARSREEDGTTSLKDVFPPVFCQQGTLQPVQLRADALMTPSGLFEFDVINTSNLAEHLGVVNLLVAAAPLLKTTAHAVLLTSFMAALQNLSLYKNTSEFYQKYLCMGSQASTLLLGVVPASRISSVVGHQDANATVTGMVNDMMKSSQLGAVGEASLLRLAWRRPAQAFAHAAVHTAGSSPTGIDISPSDFVSLVLPVYKAMFANLPNMARAMSGSEGRQECIRALSTPMHYTSVSFIRLLALAGRQLRLDTKHFEAALKAMIVDSGLIMASNMMHEQMALFHAMDLVPIRPSPNEPGAPLDTRRVVLLVPHSGLMLLRAFSLPEIYLSLAGTRGTFDNHFSSLHMAFVRVRRGRSGGGSRGGGNDNGWRSLSDHLCVRDTRADDPAAELMISALVPSFAFSLAPLSETEVRLRPRDSVEMMRAPKDVMDKMGGMLWKCFFKANLTDKDRTAILTPGGDDPFGESGGASTIDVPLACPKTAVTDRLQEAPSPTPSTKSEPALLHRIVDGKSTVDHSVELICNRPAGKTRDAGFVYRIKFIMITDHAREALASATPAVAGSLDPCCVRVTLGKGLLTLVAHLPFPVNRNAVDMKFSRRQGFVLFTVPPLRGSLHIPSVLTACAADGGGMVPSNLWWPPCVPLSSLPKVDFNAEWSFDKVMGEMSFTHEEYAARNGPFKLNTTVDAALLGLKESVLAVTRSATTSHTENGPGWNRTWTLVEDPDYYGEPAIWIWVNDLLLDSSNEALVVDCCVLPVACRSDELSEKLHCSLQFGSSARGSQFGPGGPCAPGGPLLTSKAYAGEIKLWLSLLPVAVERARESYAHGDDCTYSRTSHDSAPILCKCGMGKDLPPAFVETLKFLHVNGEENFYRAALSPLYVPQRMDEISPLPKPSTAAPAPQQKNSTTPCSASQTNNTVPSSAPQTNRNARMTVTAGSAGCSNCGKDGSLRPCSRCRQVRYCSKDCQRQHWREHRRDCG